MKSFSSRPSNPIQKIPAALSASPQPKGSRRREDETKREAVISPENTEITPRMNSQNLRAPWAKGESGNPKGRPKELPALRSLLASLLSEESASGESASEQILRSLISEAKRGNIRAAELVLKRAYGDAPSVVEIQSKEKIKLSWFTDEEEEE